MEANNKDVRYAAMLEKLTAMDTARQRQAESRRHDAAASASPHESAGAFQAAFEQQRGVVEESLRRLREAGSGAAAAKADMDSIAKQIAAMDKMVADASYFLPPYDVQTSRSAVNRLKDSLDVALAELLPKKKFSFRSKNSPKEKSIDAKEKRDGTISQDDNLAVDGSIDKNSSLPEKELEQGSENSWSLISDQAAANFHSIRDRKNATIVHDSGGSSETEVTLSNLVHCTVFLRGVFRAMFIHKLKHCHVYVSAVTGSILLEEIEGGIFMLASHQIRIHSTTNADFYLRVRSRPIVEYVSNVRVAPYAFLYQGIEEHHKAANLADESGLWEKVDDFRWLRASASPNWSILPADQRVPLVDGTNVSSRAFPSNIT